MIDRKSDANADDMGGALGVIAVGDGEGWSHIPPGVVGQVLTVLDTSGHVGYSAASGLSAISASSLLGNPTGSSALPEAITLGANLSFSGTTLVASGGSGSGSANVVYASSISGIHLNGSTDDTAIIQAVLDAHGEAGTPLRLVMDGMSAVNTLYLWSNQWLDGLAGLGGLRKLPNPASNGLPLVTNKHWVAGTTTPGGTDQYITVSNVYLDGNRRNGGGGPAFPNGTAPYLNGPFGSNTSYVVPTILLAGLSYFRVDNVYVYDSPAFGIQFTNCYYGLVTNFSKYAVSGDSYPGNDVYHCCGYCYGIHAFGVNGSGSDDSIAFNANDENDATSPAYVFFPFGSASGPIQSCSVI